MKNKFGTGGRAALAMYAAVGLAPDCLAQFAATEQIVVQKDEQRPPLDASTVTRPSFETSDTARGNGDSAPSGIAADRTTLGTGRKREGARGPAAAKAGGSTDADVTAADVERGYDRAISTPDNGNLYSQGSGGLNSASDGRQGAAGIFNSAAESGGNSNGGSGRNSEQGGSNSGGNGIEGGLNSFGGAKRGRSENDNGNGNRHSNGGPAENGNAGGGRDATGASATNVAGRGNSAGSGSRRSEDRNGNEAAPNNSGREPDNSQKDKSGADGEDRSASNDSNANDNDRSRGSNSDAPPDSNSDGAAKPGAPDRPEEEGWSASSDPVGQAAARRRFGDLTPGVEGADPLGKKRDAETIDVEDALGRIGERMDPLTGNVSNKAPVADGVSPLLRTVVETAKKRKQKQ